MKPTGNLIVDGMIQIVTAHVGQNTVDSAKLPELMKSVSATLLECMNAATGSVSTPVAEPAAPVAVAAPTPAPAAARAPAATRAVAPAPEPKDVVDPRWKDLPTKPVVPVSKSILKDFIVCLFDGEKRKMMSRYILMKYGMTPEQYRAYWKLPDDYPMTAPGYSDEKRIVAVSQGLGKNRVVKKTAKKKSRKSA
jgi:predicted transcriptional regulator